MFFEDKKFHNFQDAIAELSDTCSVYDNYKYIYYIFKHIGVYKELFNKHHISDKQLKALQKKANTTWQRVINTIYKHICEHIVEDINHTDDLVFLSDIYPLKKLIK